MTPKRPRPTLTAAALVLLATVPVATQALAQPGPHMVQAPSDLRRYNVTVRRFDPVKGFANGTDFVLPVDSPDEEHAIAAAMSNAVAFTQKLNGGAILPVAFACIAITPR